MVEKPYSHLVVGLAISEPHIKRNESSSMRGKLWVATIPGRGLKGDRYEARQGAYSGTRMADEGRAVSIISTEGLQRANKQLAERNHYTFLQTRRNVLVNMSEQELNGLVGQEFRIGNTIMRGVELCDPCLRPGLLLNRTLEERKSFEQAFTTRGGLRAEIVGVRKWPLIGRARNQGAIHLGNRLHIIS